MASDNEVASVIELQPARSARLLSSVIRAVSGENMPNVWTNEAAKQSVFLLMKRHYNECLSHDLLILDDFDITRADVMQMAQNLYEACQTWAREYAAQMRSLSSGESFEMRGGAFPLAAYKECFGLSTELEIWNHATNLVVGSELFILENDIENSSRDEAWRMIGKFAERIQASKADTQLLLARFVFSDFYLAIEIRSAIDELIYKVGIDEEKAEAELSANPERAFELVALRGDASVSLAKTIQERFPDLPEWAVMLCVGVATNVCEVEFLGVLPDMDDLFKRHWNNMIIENDQSWNAREWKVKTRVNIHGIPKQTPKTGRKPLAENYEAMRMVQAVLEKHPLHMTTKDDLATYISLASKQAGGRGIGHRQAERWLEQYLKAQ